MTKRVLILFLMMAATAIGANLTSISPTSGIRGTTVRVTYYGTYWMSCCSSPYTYATINPLAGITMNYISGDEQQGSNQSFLTYDFVISPSATLGVRNATVDFGGVTSNSLPFTVVDPPVPTLSSISPTSGIQGRTVAVTLTGTNMTGVSTITVSGGGVSVNTLTVVNTTTVTANFSITSGAAVSARNVTVTNSYGTSGSVTFTVNPAPNTRRVILVN
jgi:hypothetical protein